MPADRAAIPRARRGDVRELRAPAFSSRQRALLFVSREAGDRLGRAAMIRFWRCVCGFIHNGSIDANCRRCGRSE